MDIKELNKTLADVEAALLRKGVEQIRKIVTSREQSEPVQTRTMPSGLITRPRK